MSTAIILGTRPEMIKLSPLIREPLINAYKRRFVTITHRKGREERKAKQEDMNGFMVK